MSHQPIPLTTSADTATPLALGSYPRILETIARCADYSTSLALRAVNKRLWRTVDRHLATHLVWRGQVFLSMALPGDWTERRHPLSVFHADLWRVVVPTASSVGQRPDPLQPSLERAPSRGGWTSEVKNLWFDTVKDTQTVSIHEPIYYGVLRFPRPIDVLRVFTCVMDGRGPYTPGVLSGHFRVIVFLNDLSNLEGARVSLMPFRLALVAPTLLLISLNALAFLPAMGVILGGAVVPPCSITLLRIPGEMQWNWYQRDRQMARFVRALLDRTRHPAYRAQAWLEHTNGDTRLMFERTHPLPHVQTNFIMPKVYHRYAIHDVLGEYLATITGGRDADFTTLGVVVEGWRRARAEAGMEG